MPPPPLGGAKTPQSLRLVLAIQLFKRWGRPSFPCSVTVSRGGQGLRSCKFYAVSHCAISAREQTVSWSFCVCNWPNCEGSLLLVACRCFGRQAGPMILDAVWLFRVRWSWHLSGSPSLSAGASVRHASCAPAKVSVVFCSAIFWAAMAFCFVRSPVGKGVGFCNGYSWSCPAMVLARRAMFSSVCHYRFQE